MPCVTAVLVGEYPDAEEDNGTGAAAESADEWVAEQLRRPGLLVVAEFSRWLLELIEQVLAFIWVEF